MRKIDLGDLYETRIVELIKTNDLKGMGRPGDPYRRVVQFYTPQGEFIFAIDPTAEKETATENFELGYTKATSAIIAAVEKLTDGHADYRVADILTAIETAGK